MSETKKISDAIDTFAEAMKKRMLTKAKAGWGGWNYNTYPSRLLTNAASAAVNDDAKSAVDCANFCMMTWMQAIKKVGEQEG